MRVVTNTDALTGVFGYEKTLTILDKSGFEGTDLSMFDLAGEKSCWLQPDWISYAKSLKALADRLNVPFVQAHAPYPSSGIQEGFDAFIFRRIVRSLEVCSELGIPRIVVHPKNHRNYYKYKRELFAENVAFYQALVPHCQRTGVQVCAENLQYRDPQLDVIRDTACSQPEEFCALVDTVGSPWIAACLDTGHAALTGTEPEDFIRALGPRLQAIHINDMDYHRDRHYLPFLGLTKWDPVLKTLAESGFSGDFTFEADNFYHPFPPELRPSAARMMADTGHYLVNRLNTFKQEDYHHA